MANKKVLHKRSNVINADGSPKQSTDGQLDYGELAINYADTAEVLSIKNSNNDIIAFIPKRAFIEAPIVSETDYLIGIKDGELCRYKPKTVSYRLVGGDVGDSVVVIDDEPITIPANETIEGTCYDITDITTNNLEEIHIWGDVSLTIGNGSTYNDTVKVVEMQFSKTFSRSFYQLCGYLRALTDATVTGGKPTSCERVFVYCGGLVSANVSGQDFCESESMDSMFSNCVSLPTVDVGDWDVSHVQMFGSMFSTCTSLTQLDVSKWKIESGERFGNMFANDSLLTELDVSGWAIA